MKKTIVLGVVLALALAGEAGAFTYCNTVGSHTYCDDGRIYDQYGKTIIERRSGRRYRTFSDGKTYDTKNGWIQKEKNGYTSRGIDRRDQDVLPSILDNEDSDDSDE